MNMKKTPLIFAIGANPAWEKTLFFAKLAVPGTNHAAKREAYPAGKGVNFCRAAKCHGKCKTSLLQFAGGSNGRLLEESLKEEGLSFESVRIKEETRCSVTCLETLTSAMSEFVEPSPKIDSDEKKEFISRMRAMTEKAEGIAVCGSLPQGCNSEILEESAKIALKAGIPILFDSFSYVQKALDVGGHSILKVNHEELAKITGTGSIENELAVARKRWPDLGIAVTDGPHSAFLALKGETYRFSIPSISSPVNTLGAGDTASAVFLSEILMGNAMANAFALALASASANCVSSIAGNFKNDIRDQLRGEIEAVRL